MMKTHSEISPEIVRSSLKIMNAQALVNVVSGKVNFPT